VPYQVRAAAAKVFSESPPRPFSGTTSRGISCRGGKRDGALQLFFWLGAVGVAWSDDKEAEVSIDARKGLEIRQRFAELSRGGSELPKLLALKAEVEQARAAYSEAFEAALAREDPEIFKQYRGLFEARIKRLQERKPQSSQTVSATTEVGQTSSEKEQIAAARKRAEVSLAVQEALQKWSSAKSDEERDAAKAAYVEALRKAMFESDSSLKSILLEGVDLPTAVLELPVTK
jgi:hypothetical protein